MRTRVRTSLNRPPRRAFYFGEALRRDPYDPDRIIKISLRFSDGSVVPPVVIPVPDLDLYNLSFNGEQVLFNGQPISFGTGSDVGNGEQITNPATFSGEPLTFNNEPMSFTL